MTRRLFVVVAVLVSSGVSILGQAKPSIQGVWRAVELTVTNPNPTPGLHAKGTHTNLQPALLIITAKHYSTTSDNAAQPRSTAAFKDANRPTAADAAAIWGPFTANAGTYELAGNVMTRHPIVAKNPGVQGPKTFQRYTVKFDANNLWTTIVETDTGKSANPATIKYTRVE